jgi:hypothetical protein
MKSNRTVIADRTKDGTFDIKAGGILEEPKLIAESVDQSISDVSVLMTQMNAHIALRPEGSADLTNVVVVMNKELMAASAKGDGALVQNLKQRYQVMAQGLRKTFSAGKKAEQEVLIEVSSQDELIQKVNAFISEGRKVIVLDNNTITNGLDQSAISGKKGEDYCVVSSNISGEYAKDEFPFININAMAMMGVGIMHSDTDLFKTAYKIFTGQDAPEDIVNNLREKVLWIIRALPRLIKFTNELSHDKELRRLFDVSA